MARATGNKPKPDTQPDNTDAQTSSKPEAAAETPVARPEAGTKPKAIRPKTKDEQTAETLWVRCASGLSQRFRAGIRFSRNWQAVDCSKLSAQQEAFIREDSRLEVRDEAPADVADNSKDVG